jgi:hypothetical protein
MSKEEQKLWFQGDFSAYHGMTGWELKNELDRVETRFWNWYSRNIYDVYFEVIRDFEKLSGDSPYLAQLSAVKDTIFRTTVKNDIFDGLDIACINRSFDEYFKTNYFSNLYATNTKQIDKMCSGRGLEDLLSKKIEYKLIIPGKLISANTSLISNDTLTWEITAIRLIPDNYELTATSRRLNIWAFAVVFLFIALSVYCLMKVRIIRINRFI